MTITTRNRDFQEARRAKADEFYTSLQDIERELKHYTPHFEGKVVYCNCDDPRASNFFRFFARNFEQLGLKKLITTCYRSQYPNQFGRADSDHAVYLEYTGDRNGTSLSDGEVIGIEPLSGDGDFRSAESAQLLHQADIVVTNPPFSLFREYVAQLMEHQKQFLILGNMNALTYKEIFPHFQNDQMWYGPSIRSGDREFRVPDDYPLTAAGTRVDNDGNKYVRVKGVRWFTNLDYPGRHDELALHRTYTPHAYPTYANFDAIDVSKTMDIPVDYDGPMGVPITFLDKYSPRQFDILGSSKTLGRPMSKIAKKGTYQQGGPRFYLPNGDGTYRRMYDRIVIKNKQPA
ncbi:MAG: adenine-specific methyltransferase EcoRI family protein [Intrasporangium sp.]|uniref:adenine-specific methyltransferase EcoRI family protein n=1 Tax=Intrasporangium sp. TaxID=1925024 RepID=UPI00264A0DFE|nr:adenine-specific methyltransferase EcoRI family protein [Intrasporangium sp.]MDN5795465.1 adenine-specific methyltransferase EcoRI family protein [Intrasporangium sp.]